MHIGTQGKSRSCSHSAHKASALTPDFSQHEDRRAVSQYMENKVFEKVMFVSVKSGDIP